MENNIAEIKLEAAMWIVKCDHNSLQADPEFINWFNTSDEHKQIFESLCQNWQTLECLSDDSRSSEAPDKVTPLTFKGALKVKRPPIKLMSYMALVASIFFFSIIYFNIDAQYYSQNYKTEVAQQAQFDLPDGSSLWLNAQSEVLVYFDDDSRQLTILRGDAHFEVAKDKIRPFVVRYEQHQFIALGTAFTVNTRPFLQLTVTEHKVKVNYKHTNRVVQEGYLTEFNEYWQTAKVIQSGQNWREEKLNFKARYLKDVLTQIQPYVSEPINLLNQDMAFELISGTVNLEKPEQALKLITSGLGLEIVHENNELILN
jgi:transmembrane sensor